MNADATLPPDQSPSYVWIARASESIDSAQTKQWAQNLIYLFQDGFQWKDLPTIMEIARQFVSDFPHLSLQEKRNKVNQILNDFIDLTDTPMLPDNYSDPIFHAIVPSFVNILITEETLDYMRISGKPTPNTIQETAKAVLDAFKDGFQWQDLAEVTQFGLAFAERYPDLTAIEKSAIAKEIVNFVIDETDTPYLIDSVSDPIFKQFVHPMIDTYFHVMPH